MANIARRIVSGNKSRFKDSTLNLELDLAYITDHVIVMGFPAAGIEGLYRNRREDAKKFLDSRHGTNYWIFNFCPIRENSYPAAYFGGRVSRYPFPDHHAPPLALIPLFVREVHEWLSGSPDRVAVLHCKAGKGRSGTLACSYLLSLDQKPMPPMLKRSMTKKEWASRKADDVMLEMETKGMVHELTGSREEQSYCQDSLQTEVQMAIDEPRTMRITNETSSKEMSESSTNNSDVTSNIQLEKDFTNEGNRNNSLDDILALHTSRRMKAPSSAPSSSDKKVKHGVSIPSQRRFLQYWSRLLSGAGPPMFWAAPLPRICLREVKIRMRKMSGVKMNVIKFANNMIQSTQSGKQRGRSKEYGPVWVSVARYNDEFVDTLEEWERHTRSEDGNMGKRRPGSDHMGNESFHGIFRDGKWDKDKMIRSFACLGNVEGADKSSSDDNMTTYSLKPLTDKKWKTVQEQIANRSTSHKNPPTIVNEGSSGETSTPSPLSPGSSTPVSASSSVTDLTHVLKEAGTEEGIILDSGREVRLKLFMGQVFMGWIWFIPAFHVNLPTVEFTKAEQLLFVRKEVDFPIGIGSALLNVEVSMKWVKSQ